jgi:hypothetical protein
MEMKANDTNAYLREERRSDQGSSETVIRSKIKSFEDTAARSDSREAVLST